jgi:hypothetical protein
MPPMYVLVKPWPHAEANWCLDNTGLYLTKHSGQGHLIVNGWNIWETPGVWLEAEAHSIIRKKDGTFVDITPREEKLPRILFLPDSFSNETWQAGMISNRVFPISNDPRLLELVETRTKMAAFRARWPFGTLLTDAKGIEIGKRETPNLNFALLSESDYREYKSLEAKIKKLKAELKLY